MAKQPPETKIVDSPKIACDGGEGPLGHPRVFLNMGNNSEIQCPYCGRNYILSASPAKVAAH